MRKVNPLVLLLFLCVIPVSATIYPSKCVFEGLRCADFEAYGDGTLMLRLENSGGSVLEDISLESRFGSCLFEGRLLPQYSAVAHCPFAVEKVNDFRENLTLSFVDSETGLERTVDGYVAQKFPERSLLGPALSLGLLVLGLLLIPFLIFRYVSLPFLVRVLLVLCGLFVWLVIWFLVGGVVVY